MIVPTIGRVVYFRPGKGARARMNVITDNPFRADIVNVWDDRYISLNIDDHAGQRHFAERVLLLQDGETPPPDGSYCEWMPYQKAVAKGEIAPTLHATGSPRHSAAEAGAPHVSTKGTELDSH